MFNTISITDTQLDCHRAYHQQANEKIIGYLQAQLSALLEPYGKAHVINEYSTMTQMLTILQGFPVEVEAQIKHNIFRQLATVRFTSIAGALSPSGSIQIKAMEGLYWGIRLSEFNAMHNSIGLLLELGCSFNDIEARACQVYGLDGPFHSSTAGFMAQAAVDNNVEALKVLLRHGFAIDAADQNNITALSYAVQCGHHDSIAFLLANYANPNIKDIFGHTLLHLGIEQCSMQSYQLLIDNVRDIDAVALDLGTVFDYAKYAGRDDLLAILETTFASSKALPFRPIIENGFEESPMASGGETRPQVITPKARRAWQPQAAATHQFFMPATTPYQATYAEYGTAEFRI